MKFIKRLFIITVISLSISGCVVQTLPALPQQAYYIPPPPSDILEVEPPRQTSDPCVVWHKGYWHWNGYQYIWHHGRFIHHSPFDLPFVYFWMWLPQH